MNDGLVMTVEVTDNGDGTTTLRVIEGELRSAMTVTTKHIDTIAKAIEAYKAKERS